MVAIRKMKTDKSVIHTPIDETGNTSRSEALETNSINKPKHTDTRKTINEDVGRADRAHNALDNEAGRYLTEHIIFPMCKRRAKRIKHSA